MRSAIIVIDQPGTEIALPRVAVPIDLVAARDPTERVPNSAMEALAASVCLRAPGLAAAVIAVLDSAAELGFGALRATKRGATIAPHARPPDAVLGIKWDYPMVEDLGRGDRVLRSSSAVSEPALARSSLAGN